MGAEIDFLQFPHVARNRVSTEEARKIARRFDRDFFDGDRSVGYGGYRYDGRWQAVAARMVKNYGLETGDCVLDVGCAKGFLVKDFQDLNVDCYGIDVSRYAIRNAVTKNCQVGNASRIPFAPLQFDLAVSINTLHNLSKSGVVKALQEMKRVSTNQYIVVDAWRTPQEKKNILEWNLTAKTIMHVNDWLAFFRKVGYTGDWCWTLNS